MVGGYTPLNEMVPWTDLFVGQNGKIVRRGLRLKKTGREERRPSQRKTAGNQASEEVEGGEGIEGSEGDEEA